MGEQPRDAGDLRRSSRWGAWLFAILAGAILGLVILGVGGRLVMRLVALRNGQAGGWSFGGTMTVLAMGALSGASGGVIRAAAATWLPGRTPAVVGTSIFAAACLLLTLRGLHPLDATRLTFFIPLTAAYVAVFELAWRRWAGVQPDRAGLQARGA